MAPRSPIRLLTAVPTCDGHDSAINTINLELIRAGMEVVYLGYDRSARDIARAAVQEDVRAVGISSYNGGHVEFFAEVIDRLREKGARELGGIGLFGGGGGTISAADAAIMRRKGVDRIFFAGTPLAEMLAFVQQTYGEPRRRPAKIPADADARLSALLASATPPRSGRIEHRGRRIQPLRGGVARGPVGARSTPLVLGVTGPGGAGKTTLIDELIFRRLRARPQSRIAVLSHDPSIVQNGALLGDRATMIYAQDDRVFMRSLASGGRAGGLSPTTEKCLEVLMREPFDVIFVETVGIGQEAHPFTPGLVDRTIFVMSPDYGSRLQLQKIVMLDVADVVVVNKADLAGAKTACAEIERRLSANSQDQKLIATTAGRHRDAGVDALYGLLDGEPVAGVAARLSSPKSDAGPAGVGDSGNKSRGARR